MIVQHARSVSPVAPRRSAPRRLAARLEPFDSYWQAPRDIDQGYQRFSQYYKHNFLPHLPADKASRILVVSCGPGYLVNLLLQEGYEQTRGIDSDPQKIHYAAARDLPCQVARAFDELQAQAESSLDVIICEQELNHLTLDEMIDLLALCHDALTPGGTLLVYGLNGANPLVGAENLAHNIDHFSTFTEHSLEQVLLLAGFRDTRVIPLKLYVFYANPLNYVGLAATSCFHMIFRICFRLYGKDVRIVSKKIAAVCHKT